LSGLAVTQRPVACPGCPVARRCSTRSATARPVARRTGRLRRPDAPCHAVVDPQGARLVQRRFAASRAVDFSQSYMSVGELCGPGRQPDACETTCRTHDVLLAVCREFRPVLGDGGDDATSVRQARLEKRPFKGGKRAECSTPPNRRVHRAHPQGGAGSASDRPGSRQTSASGPDGHRNLFDHIAWLDQMTSSQLDLARKPRREKWYGNHRTTPTLVSRPIDRYVRGTR